ncbi:MAG: 50S ribosomal protein L17 [candidate division WOR-3 bacterium]
MRHGRRTKKLGRKKEHRLALLRNLARALFIHGQIRTTRAKAHAAQRFVERLLSYARRGTLAARRLLFSHLHSHEMVKMIIEKIVPLFKDRVSGFTRIYLLGPRLGDGAEMAILSLVERPVSVAKEKHEEKKIEKKEIKKKVEKKEERKREEKEKKEKKAEVKKAKDKKEAKVSKKAGTEKKV